MALRITGVVLLLFAATVVGADAPAKLPLVKQVERQPLAAHVVRIVDALNHLGVPLSESERNALDAANKESDGGKAAEAIQNVLDPHCLLGVELNSETELTANLGPATRHLVQQGWAQFLVKIHNPKGLKGALEITSPNARQLAGSPAEDVKSRWLELQMYDQQPMLPELSGLNLEYRIIQLYSRDEGSREAALVGERVTRNPAPKKDAPPRGRQPTRNVAGASEPLNTTFECDASRDITFRVTDEDGKPTTAAFFIRDTQGRVYPSQAKRLAPDFAFHPQIYRGDGETVKLPRGTYTVACARGPESIPETKMLQVGDGPAEFRFQVRRWVDPTKLGWYSGDHHIHAAGCAHYSNPTQGVHAEDMIRHCLGEDLKVGCNLTWGPCFDYQLQFFTGKDDPVSRYPYLLRYDIEVSGFGSHRSGHLCLLRLKERNYPGGDSNVHWPTLGLSTLRWAKKQGAITGPAHSGSGLAPSEIRVADTDGPNGLPSYAIPIYDGIGANEFIVDITHQVPGPDGKPVPAVDFISTMDTNRKQELNMWYHALNCGIRVRASGETDFPCISGARVGMGRVYVKVDGKLNYDDWCEGIREGRSYVSDGTSHLMDFAVSTSANPEQKVSVGQNESELKLPKVETIRLTARVAALLGDKKSSVEAIVNGYPVAHQDIVADGSMQDVSVEVPIERSSWVALRLYPSAHTNPVFVVVGDQPIRASRRSATWCLRGVDQCWKEKERTYAAAEKDEAAKAYEHAREVYRKIENECQVD